MRDDFKQKRHSLREKQNISTELHFNYLRIKENEILEELKQT